MCVLDEKSAMALDGLDLKSPRDSTKFSKPLMFSATSGMASMSAAVKIVVLAFIVSFLVAAR